MSAKQAHDFHKDDIAAGKDRCCCIVPGCFKTSYAKHVHGVYEIQRHVKDFHKNEHAQLQGRFPYELVAFRSKAENRQLEENYINTQLTGSMQVLNLQQQPSSNVSVSNSRVNQDLSPFSGSFTMSSSTPRQSIQPILLPSNNTFHTIFLVPTASSKPHQQGLALTNSAHLPYNDISNQAEDKEASQAVVPSQAMSAGQVQQWLPILSKANSKSSPDTAHLIDNEDSLADGLPDAIYELAKELPNGIGGFRQSLTTAEQLDAVELATVYVPHLEEENLKAQTQATQQIQVLTQQLLRAEEDKRRGQWAIEMLRDGSVVCPESSPAPCRSRRRAQLT